MENEDKGKENFFDILISYQSYLRFLYALFALPLSIIFFCIILVFITLGIVMFPLGIGIYILNFSFRVLHIITKKEEKIIEYYIGINLPKVSIKLQENNHAFLNFKEFINDIRNWKRILYFIIKPIFIIPFIIPAFAFLLILATLVIMPLKSVFGHINFFGFFTTDSFIELIFFYFLSAIFLVAILHLNNAATKASCSITKKFLSR